MQQAGGQTGRMPQAHDLIEIPLQTRDAQIVPSTWRDDDSTVEAIWTTGARRRAYNWITDQAFDEELVVDEAAVDMSRFEAGAVQLLDGHRAYGGTDAILGIATRGWIADGNGHAQLKLRTSTPALAAVAADVKAGLIRTMSFGYTVQRYEITRPVDRTDGGTVPLYRAVRWTPHEISIVAVPADSVNDVVARLALQLVPQISTQPRAQRLVRDLIEPIEQQQHPAAPQLRRARASARH